MIKEIIVAFVSSALVALAGYLLVVKENQVNIKNIQRELVELKNTEKENGKSLVATKLFVAQAHPNRDASSLVSLMKLKRFKDSEIRVLASSLADVKVNTGSTKEIVKLPNELRGLVQRHNLNGNDFAIYSAVANSRPQNSANKP